MGKGSKKSQQNQRFVSHQQNIVIIKTYMLVNISLFNPKSYCRYLKKAQIKCYLQDKTSDGEPSSARNNINIKGRRLSQSTSLNQASLAISPQLRI